MPGPALLLRQHHTCTVGAGLSLHMGKVFSEWHVILTRPPVAHHHASVSPLSQLHESSGLCYSYGRHRSLHLFTTDTQVNIHAEAQVTAKNSTCLRPGLGEDQASSPCPVAVAVRPNPHNSSIRRDGPVAQFGEGALALR